MNNFRITQLAAAFLFASLPLMVHAAESTTAPATPATAEKPAVAQAEPSKSTPTIKPVKIGYVDISKIGMESDYGKAVKERLLKKKKELEEKVIAKRKGLEKHKKGIEAKLPVMTPKQREAESKKFQKKVEELQKLAEKSEEEFAKYQELETETAYKLIEQIVSDYGKSSGLALIMVKKELLYLDSGVEPQDLTGFIMKKVNEAKK